MEMNKVPPRERLAPPEMNKTEAAYAVHLDALKACGEILGYRFESVKLRLAGKTFYTPDFQVIRRSQIEFHEVKGFWREDARVKIKVAAHMYPEFAFQAVRKTRDGWEYEAF